jgi:hypothetical protein
LTLVISGSGNVVQAVTTLLTRYNIIAPELQMEHMGLDDALIAHDE